MKPDRGPLLHALARAAPRVLPVDDAEGWCIFSTRAAIEVLRRRRIDAYALVCEALVINATDSYELVIGDTTMVRPGGWPGHLVAIVERRWLLDLTLGQGTRPAHGILLGPVVVPVNEPFLRGREYLGGVVNGSRVAYRSRPGDRSYRAGRAWLGSIDDVAGRLATALTTELSRPG